MGQCGVKMEVEVEIGVTWLQAEDCQQTPRNFEGARKDSPAGFRDTYFWTLGF